MPVNQKSIESCPYKYEIFKAIKIWENARAANAFSRSIKKILADETRRFHLEEIDNNTWKLFEQKNDQNILLQKLHRDIKNGY